VTTPIARRPAPQPVGTEILAAGLIPGDEILIEARHVDGYQRGEGREVLAVVKSVRIMDKSWSVWWAGVIPGRKTETTGSALYDAGAVVTVLRSSQPMGLAA